MDWAAAMPTHAAAFFYYSYLSREARQTNQESKGTAGVALAAVPPRLARDRGPTLLVHHSASPFKIGPSERLLLCGRSHVSRNFFCGAQHMLGRSRPGPL